jgi:flagellar basal-body rod protein FlgB
MVPVERSSFEDGNNVVLDMELANMTENALLYEAGVRLLSQKLMIYKNAIKAPN